MEHLWWLLLDWAEFASDYTIWLHNIISQEYDNKKDGIFLDFPFLMFIDFLL